ncbi:hypothetical protein [Aquitalea magnusonii]|uniref:hypothetical protein n=1 Tax=Aquitalea magnusonii TaxID=332411 RepID=UPI00142E1D93|nr:hypothetical protein [Aquitalea magnusonii]
MQTIIRVSGFPHWVVAGKIKTKNNFAPLSPAIQDIRHQPGEAGGIIGVICPCPPKWA